MLEKVRAYLSKQLEISPDMINEDTTFESLGIDSLDMVEMMMDMESELGVELDLQDKLNTVGELITFIESKLN